MTEKPPCNHLSKNGELNISVNFYGTQYYDLCTADMVDDGVSSYADYGACNSCNEDLGVSELKALFEKHPGEWNYHGGWLEYILHSLLGGDREETLLSVLLARKLARQIFEPEVSR